MAPMEFYDAVYHAAWKKGITIEKLSLSLGHASNYIVSGKSRNSLPRIDTAVKILDACNYSLYAVPKDEKMPEEAILITIPRETEQSS